MTMKAVGTRPKTGTMLAGWGSTSAVPTTQTGSPRRKLGLRA